MPDLPILLKKLRKEKGWSTKQAALKSGVSVGFVHRAENGQADPGFSKLSKLLKALGVEIELKIQT